MTTEKYAMSEKILQEINNVMEKDAGLSEFEIIPMPSSQNKSPVLYADHCLGLESWCTKYLYCYVYDRIKHSRKQKKKALFDDDLIKQLNCALLLNPDVTSFWNMRRELVEKKLLTVEGELKFSQLVLSRKHKCNDAFGYRRWLICMQDALSLTSLNMELHLSQLCADRSPCNCHAWTHRNWVMQKYIDLNPLILNGSASSVNSHVQILLNELEFTENWISTHVSDYSGFHYRQFVLDNIQHNIVSFDSNFLSSDICVKCLNYLVEFLTNNNEQDINIHNSTSGDLILHLFSCTVDLELQNKVIVITLLLIYDLVLCQQLSEIFQNHESIWSHRRYIVHALFKIINEISPDKTSFKVNLNELYTLQQSGTNIVSGLDLDQIYNNAIKSPKKTKREYPLNRLARAIVHNEKQFADNLKYLKWCQFILHVPLG